MKRNAICSLLIILAATPAFAEGGVPYPAGYRDWKHVKSMVIQPGHPLHASFGGIHHIYANGPALQGYKTGRFPEGSVLIFDLLEAEAAGNAITEGKRKVLGVMHRNSSRYAATGGWGYEGFEAGNPAKRLVGGKAQEACHGCHEAQKDKGFVYSAARD